MTFRARDGSGAVNVKLDAEGEGGDLQILIPSRGIFGVHLSPDELRALGKALLKVSAAALAQDDESTERAA